MNAIIALLGDIDYAVDFLLSLNDTNDPSGVIRKGTSEAIEAARADLDALVAENASLLA